MFYQEAGQPMTGEGPEPIAAGVASSIDNRAKARVVGVNGFGAFGEGGDPGTREGSVEPDGGFFPNSDGNGKRDDGSFGQDFRFWILDFRFGMGGKPRRQAEATDSRRPAFAALRRGRPRQRAIGKRWVE